MTQNEIIEMAKQAGLSNPLWIKNDYAIIESFAKLVSAKEREACAKIADRHSACTNDTPNVIAITIRARGKA